MFCNAAGMRHILFWEAQFSPNRAFFFVRGLLCFLDYDENLEQKRLLLEIPLIIYLKVTLICAHMAIFALYKEYKGFFCQKFKFSNFEAHFVTKLRDEALTLITDRKNEIKTFNHTKV